MKAVMYGAAGDDALVEMRETLFEKELDLQEFLTKHPALLAGHQMNPTDPRRFMLITEEIGIAIAEGGGAYFLLDHLFIDQDGIPTLVEVKRSTDTQLRREVVGQMLEYAANACAHWTIEYLQTLFERRCEKHHLDPTVELRYLHDNFESEPQVLWNRVAQNLKQERLRLVFLADKFLPETQRIIEFLNRQMQTSEVFAVEVRQYIGGGMKTLVPRVLNTSVMQADRRSATAAPIEVWTEERFYAGLLERSGAEAVRVMRSIQAWAQEQPHVVLFFGKGKYDGSIQITHKFRDDRHNYQPGEDTVFLSLWSFGRIEIEFEYLMKRAPFVSDEKRRELYNRLTAGSSLTIEANRIRTRPSVLWSELVDAKNMQCLIAAMEWVVEQLNAPASEQTGAVSIT